MAASGLLRPKCTALAMPRHMPTTTLGLFLITSSRVTTALPNRLSKVLGRNSMNSMPRFSSSATMVSHAIHLRARDELDARGVARDAEHVHVEPLGLPVAERGRQRGVAGMARRDIDGGRPHAGLEESARRLGKGCAAGGSGGGDRGGGG